MDNSTYLMKHNIEVEIQPVIQTLRSQGATESQKRSQQRSADNHTADSTGTWLTVAECEKILKLSKSTIYRRCNRGEYTIKIIESNGGKTFRILLSSLPLESQQKYWMDRVTSIPAVLRESSSQDEEETWREEIARARYTVLQKYYDYVLKNNSKSRSKVEIKKQFANAYNKKFLPDLHDITGDISYSTLERWKKKLRDNDNDYRVLAPKWGKKRKGNRSISKAVADILIKHYLKPNAPKIAEVIRDAIDEMQLKGIEYNVSKMTMRRYIEDWHSEHGDLATFLREGEQALNVKYLKNVNRDPGKILPGDVVVADGHVLNFDILNPWTGKPKRMTLIACWDMHSQYFLGSLIMPTEDTKAIAEVYRRVILTLGFVPKVFYIDNGRAFKSQYFTQSSEADFLGIGGLFERLGTKYVAAWAYHGQSKTIERGFGSLGEIERKFATYVGYSIEKKPARMNRGEKWHNRMYELYSGATPTLFEAELMVRMWMEAYHRREHQGGYMQDRSPLDVYETGLDQVRQQPDFASRQVTLDKLAYLMMEHRQVTLYADGIKMFGNFYYHPALYQYEKGRRDDFTVKYSTQDLNAILVFKDNEYLCTAEKQELQHPMAKFLGTDVDVEKLQSELQMIRGTRKHTVQIAEQYVRSHQDDLPALPEDTREELQAQSESLAPEPEPEDEKDYDLSDFAGADAEESDGLYGFETDREYEDEN